jgi:hypothetical protein
MTATIFDFPLHGIRRKPLWFYSAGAATEYIDDEEVKPGYVHIVTRVSLENETSAFTQFRLGVWDGTNFQISEEQKYPAASTVYWTADPIHLSEGENLRVELKGCTSGDKIRVYIDSFVRKLSEEG